MGLTVMAFDVGFLSCFSGLSSFSSFTFTISSGPPRSATLVFFVLRLTGFTSSFASSFSCGLFHGDLFQVILVHFAMLGMFLGAFYPLAFGSFGAFDFASLHLWMLLW
jgi:hypothetical protein